MTIRITELSRGLLLRIAAAVALCLAALSSPVSGESGREVITAGNADQLQPVARIDYAALPDEAGRVESGGFVSNRDATRLAVRNRQDSIVILDDAGTVLDVFSVPGADNRPDTILDMSFNGDGTLLAALASDGATYSVAVRILALTQTLVLPFPNEGDMPFRVWFEPESPYLWLEVMPGAAGQAAYVARMAYPLPGFAQSDVDLLTLPSGPENDPEAFARIGRIAPPRAVTSTHDGEVQLWNLQTGEVTASAAVGEAAVFGGINPGATHLAWRDPESRALHLLDFATGEDRIVAPLDGDYISYILLSPDADVIFGVDVGGEPKVIAWDTATGERRDLGPYRQCSRTPDMARLSADGTTLVIGCDTGLEIWRVNG